MCQTNACFSYLGRKLDLWGQTPQEHSYCEQLLCEVYDLRNKMTGFAYGPDGSKKEGAEALLKNASGILGKYGRR